MSGLHQWGLSQERLGACVLAYLVVLVAALWFANRRGGRALAVATLAMGGLSLGLLLGLLWLLLHPSAAMAARAEEAGIARGAWVLAFRGQIWVLERPAALAVLAGLPWLVLALLTSLTDMTRKQLWLQLGLRALMFFCVALALAQPALLTEKTRVSLVALVDVSDSVSDAQLVAVQQTVGALEKLGRARGEDVSVVRFAGRARLAQKAVGDGAAFDILRGPGWQKGEAAALRSEASNLQAALQLSYGLHAPGTLRRVALFSDGNQTEGDVMSEALSAQRKGVKVGFFALPSEQTQEVLVRELRLVSDASDGGQLKVGAPFVLEAEIYSTRAQSALVTLYQGARQNPGDSERKLELSEGRNLVRFRGQIDEAGVENYRVEVTAQSGQTLQDRFASNNQAVLPLYAHGRPRILYIEGEASAKGYLTQALKQENIEVEVRGPYGLPSNVRELLGFDLVLVSDVPSLLLSQGQMLALGAYVRDHGGGFVMAGGEGSFGSGGYQGTEIEKLLPVRFDQEKKRDQPTLAMMLCIDRSGSMSGQKLELAKDAARGTAEMLGRDDLIGVVAFDSQAIPTVRLQRAQNRVRISADIARLSAGGGTALLPPLQEAYQQLATAVAKVKHVILLTDGQAEYQGILELVHQMVAAKITVSTVGVGAGADQTLLTAIAENGGGRFYYTQDASSIPKIFSKETTQVAKSALVEERVRPVVHKFVELLDGVGIDKAPALRGYVATKAKPLAEVILVSPQGEPLLARWRQGLGQSVAFTSDVKNRWAIDWLRWPGYTKFWAQLVRSTMRHDGKNRGPGYELTAQALPPYVQVRVDAVASDDRFVSGLDTQVEIYENAQRVPGLVAKEGAGLGKLVLTAPLPQTAPGRYETELYLPKTGAFMVRAVHRSPAAGPGLVGPIVAESWGALSLSYPREYLALPPDTGLLEKIAEATGGTKLESAESAFAHGDEKLRSLRPVWMYALWMALGLLLLDVLARRVRLFGYRPVSM